MELKKITEEIKVLAENYAINAEKAVNQIERFISENGFKSKEIHSDRARTYSRDSEELADITDELTISFDVESNRIGISYHQFCDYCGEAIDALGDEIEICECSDREPVFEVCSNDEWIEQNLECPEEPDHDEINAVVSKEIDKFTELCEEAGLGIPQFTSLKGQRILYHGWNGSKFNYRNGIFGTFNKLTKKQVKILDKY